MEIGLLTEIMNVFVDAFSGGFDRLRPAISSLLHVLIGIEIVWFGILLTLGIESVSNGLKKVMTIGMWSFVALKFDQHALALVDSLVQAGLMAAGKEGQSARTLLNPSAILDAGFGAAEPLARQVLKGTSLLNMAATYPMFGFTWVMMMVAYAALAITAFMVLIEYYLAIAVVGILLPFGVLNTTRWIAMKPMSYFLSSGLRMMVIAFLIAISRTVMTKIHFASDEPTLREMWIAICCTAMIGLLCCKAPDRVAQGFMLGSASLSGADVPRHAQSVAVNTTRVASTAARVIGGVSSALGSVARSSISAGSAFYTSHSQGGGAQAKGAYSSPGAAAATSVIASAAGRSVSASKPPVLIPPPDTSDTSKKE